MKDTIQLITVYVTAALFASVFGFIASLLGLICYYALKSYLLSKPIEAKVSDHSTDADFQSAPYTA